ncbi:MAG: hypothetical protein AAF600_08820 [Bacteroidota bacterium]
MYKRLDKSKANENWLDHLDKIQDITRKNYFSVLPNEKELFKFFSEAFVINNPKGRVGGDGFWLHTRGTDIYLALFTCIGEGHLASIMIRIYMNAFKKMVEGYSIDFPGSIIQFLHREVVAHFKNKNNILLNTNANVAIVKYSKSVEAMEFAGANMNLIQVSGEGINVIEGEDKQVGESSDKVVSYSSISLENIAKSSFYLCSSGVFNLIGGANFDKMKSKDIGVFWRQNRMMEMTEQKTHTLNYLQEWTGINGQNDDVMIIGLKT